MYNSKLEAMLDLIVECISYEDLVYSMIKWMGTDMAEDMLADIITDWDIEYFMTLDDVLEN